MKGKKRYLVIIPIILYVILSIAVVGLIIYAYSTQYNLKGISNILSVYIDKDREREYVGKLNGHKIYVENLRIEELNYRTFSAKSISLKDAIEKELVSLKDWRRGAWYIFKDNGTEILRYESYEIAIANDECIIRPVSKYKSVDVKCHTDNAYRITLKKGNSFSCFLMNDEYDFKIKSIDKDYIVVTASKYGLTKVQDESINLKIKEKEFKIEKNKKVELSTQSADYNESVIIEWY